MKRFLVFIMIVMLGLIFISCASITEKERRARKEARKEAKKQSEYADEYWETMEEHDIDR